MRVNTSGHSGHVKLSPKCVRKCRDKPYLLAKLHWQRSHRCTDSDGDAGKVGAALLEGCAVDVLGFVRSMGFNSGREDDGRCDASVSGGARVPCGACIPAGNPAMEEEAEEEAAEAEAAAD